MIIECDEDQHKNYNCENKRVMELFQDLGNRPLVMIRFNPDKYKNNDNTVDGCFKYTKTGSLSLNKKQWKIRTNELIKKINYYLTYIPTKETTLEYMFYSS